MPTAKKATAKKPATKKATTTKKTATKKPATKKVTKTTAKKTTAKKTTTKKTAKKSTVEKVAINIKEEALKLIEKIQKNPKFLDEFLNDPIKFVEKKTGLDLPDEQIKKIIDQVKKEVTKKVDTKKIAAGIKTIKNLFGKK